MDFAYVGSFNYTGSQGIHICRFDRESGGLEYVKTVFPEINAGNVNVVGDVLYATDEQPGDPAKKPMAGGGRIFAFRIDPESGDLTLLDKKDTFGVNPCTITVDGTGKYAIVTHFTVGDPVTRTVRRADGTYCAEVVTNDPTTCLFRIEKDGGFGRLCDVYYHREGIGFFTMIHKAYQKPGKNLYAENDLGEDLVYFFKIDYDQERFVYLASAKACERGCGPRHGAFHPSLPYLYLNYEHRGTVARFDVSDLSEVKLIDEAWVVDRQDFDEVSDNQSEIMFHPNGKILYSFLRGKGLAAVFQVDEQTGALTLLQKIKLPGSDPRGAVFTPDFRYILVASHADGETQTMRVKEDGTLEDTGLRCAMENPASVAFYLS